MCMKVEMHLVIDENNGEEAKNGNTSYDAGLDVVEVIIKANGDTGENPVLEEHTDDATEDNFGFETKSVKEVVEIEENKMKKYRAVVNLKNQNAHQLLEKEEVLTWKNSRI